MAPYKKILIVKPSSLGDVVHSLPVLSALHKAYPGASIHWVIASGFEGLLDGHPMIERLRVINKDRWKRPSALKDTLKEIAALATSLKSERYDLVLDLQGLLRSGLITGLSRCQTRVGFKEAREGSTVFYTHTVEGGRGVHAVDRYMKIAGFAGAPTDEIEFPLLCEDIKEDWARGLKKGQYIVMAPGAAWVTKRWAARNFGRLAAKFSIPAVVVGGGGDYSLGEEVVGHAGGMAINATGKTTLKGLASLIRDARFMVTNDTGPMHIAAALGVVVFAIFGPTDPQRTGPYGTGHTVIGRDIACRACFRKKCSNVRCLRDLPFQHVYDIIADQRVSSGVI
ncbi:glycosyltransferase family 9 protein [Candidatus Magnetominusculus dajiuhuensis]|uniref:glycosyltransferase family 9 protein n=1 Tax=Candidatus Magnetominusculus dajiuhuensis TaxID=3137712 RepID=UPI003B42F6D8